MVNRGPILVELNPNLVEARRLGTTQSYRTQLELGLTTPNSVDTAISSVEHRLHLAESFLDLAVNGPKLALHVVIVAEHRPYFVEPGLSLVERSPNS